MRQPLGERNARILRMAIAERKGPPSPAPTLLSSSARCGPHP
ncbi:hypothetical protein DA2_2411 [Desulfovibrio sp. A2]|nr:hypothetical protein DA2_2411 [Desulfovibrio sp. A2]